MRYTHLRNATGLLEWGGRAILVDPMLGDAGTLPGFRMFDGPKRPNPLVDLPANTVEALARVTDVLVTHTHIDHLDPAGVAWTIERSLPVWCANVDVKHLRKQGLEAQVATVDAMGVPVEVTVGDHGRGVVGWLMGPVSGRYLAPEDAPSVYLTGDTELTDRVRALVERLRPDVIVAPAGSANFGKGPDILFGMDEMVDLVRTTDATVVFNHLEAIDHCPTTRDELRARMTDEGLADRVRIPADGEAVELMRTIDGPHALPGPADRRRPGFQKWLTSKLG